jgi:hypothetical protein
MFMVVLFVVFASLMAMKGWHDGSRPHQLWPDDIADNFWGEA